jgi:hypothetical protein
VRSYLVVVALPALDHGAGLGKAGEHFLVHAWPPPWLMSRHRRTRLRAAGARRSPTETNSRRCRCRMPELTQPDMPVLPRRAPWDSDISLGAR